MKKSYLVLCLLFLAGISVKSFAQTDPGTTNLTHQWTFDDGTAKDVVGTANGTLMGAATCSNKALNTLSGGYLDLPAADIAINTYPAVTIETWFTSSGTNTTVCTILSYFGNTTGNYGTDYVFISPTSCNRVRAAISCGNTSAPWDAETGITRGVGADGKNYLDDGGTHQMVVTLTATTMTFYIDGVSIGTVDYTGTNAISALGTQFAYLAKGGYTGDATWKGYVNKHSLYNKALSADEILYLFQKGAEKDAVITATASKLAFDASNYAETFNVTGLNLSAPITLTAPAGISLVNTSGNPITSIPANANNFPVTAAYMGGVVDGMIILASGSIKDTIYVKSADDSQCYKQLYPDGNLILDPGCAKLTNFQGWGAKEVVNIFTQPENVYCGATSIKIGNGTGTCSGSLDILDGAAKILLPNTTYRGRIMMKTIGGTFQVGVDAGPNQEFKFDTNGEWKACEFIFTTGATIGANMYVNNCGGCTATAAYIDNFELYVMQDPLLTTSITSEAFEPEYTASAFTVTGTNLTNEIEITAPAGVTVTPSILPVSSKNEVVAISWDGVTPVDGNIIVASTGLKDTIKVKSTANGSSGCFTPLYTDRLNIITNPAINSLTNLSGWGSKSSIDIAGMKDSVFCGSHSAMIKGGGSLNFELTGLLKPNTQYISKVKVKNYKTFQIGIWGYDILATSDLTDSIETNGVWQDVVFEFMTGESLGATQGIFINNYLLSGTLAFIDNWELYEKPANAIPGVNANNSKIYVSNGKLIADFVMTNGGNTTFFVYNMQGALLSTQSINAVSGTNRVELSSKLNSGVYVVKMTNNNNDAYFKVVK